MKRLEFGKGGNANIAVFALLISFFFHLDKGKNGEFYQKKRTNGEYLIKSSLPQSKHSVKVCIGLPNKTKIQFKKHFFSR